MVEPERERLLREIEAAFTGRAYPGSERVVWPGSDERSEHARLARFLDGMDWRDFSYAALRAHDGIDPGGFLYLLEPEGFAFYMPAFLQAALDVEAAPELAKSLHFILGPAPKVESDPSVAVWIRTHLATFTKLERVALGRAFAYLDARLTD